MIVVILIISVYIYIYTHIHTNIYIYIYIYTLVWRYCTSNTNTSCTVLNIYYYNKIHYTVVLGVCVGMYVYHNLLDNNAKHSIIYNNGMYTNNGKKRLSMIIMIIIIIMFACMHVCIPHVCSSFPVSYRWKTQC